MRRDREYHKKAAAEFLVGLNLEQKLLVISGHAKDRMAAGLPPLEALGEAAHGVQARHDQSFDKNVGAPVCTTIFQNPVGFAATWDKELMRRVGDLVGTEGRSLYNAGLHNALCMLAPTVDMERDPRWGRNEEAYGEDPHLTSRIAGEYIRGMAGEDPRYVRCGATLKHFYGNNVENGRSLENSNIPEHLKDSYYIRVFEEVIDYADPIAVMSSYNYVNGVPNTFNPELTTRLKNRGLPFVTGDGGVIDLAVKLQKEAESIPDALVKAIHAGMDCFAENAEVIRAGLQEALDSGKLTEEEIDRIAMNRLVACSMLGLLHPEEGEKTFPKEIYNASRVDTEEGRALSREASAEAAVLLKNETEALPLHEDERVLLLGPFADRCPMDWYSGITSHQVTLKEGIKDRIDGCESLYPYVRIRLGETRFAGLEGEKIIPVNYEDAEIFRIMLWDDSRFTIRAMSNGKLLTTLPPGHTIINSEEKGYPVLFAAQEEAFSWFALEAFRFYDGSGNPIRFTEENVLHFWEDERICGICNHDGGVPMRFETVTTAEELLDEALRIGEEGNRADEENGIDAVVAAFGLHPIVNGKEERDRTSIELPPFQRVLLRQIREKHSNVILVLHTNSPIAIVEEQEDPHVRAILWMATGSEEYGNALADVLYGFVSPAGCLCQTWYRGDDQLVDIRDYDIEKNKMTYLYMEEEPLYRFGYGLSYTTFEKTILENASDQVTVLVKNTGDRTSDCIVQVYACPDGGFCLYEDRSGPGNRLAAFTRLKDMKPGEERSVTL
ncbi:MAG: glycoside hydrolase family 3 C-terminal domain-containing protein [Eubacterium sp.]|nr:glycoside hydrolase family 3 C-terminal domain-containing protein [Eubacterium sp.]